ncbi:MAG: helix-turn-helix domain-containing protein [Cyanobacteria bacterium P01_A01_bin.114]
MAPRKLSDSDKRDVIELYKQPQHTTSTIAARYGVSNSTISRILKNLLPEDEYSALISQKRLSASADKAAPAAPETPEKRERPKVRPKVKTAEGALDESPEEPRRLSEQPEQPEEPSSSKPAPPRRRRRKPPEGEERQLALIENDPSTEESPPSNQEGVAGDHEAEDDIVEDAGVAAELIDDLDDDDFDDDFDDDDDDFDDDEVDDDDDDVGGSDDDEVADIVTPQVSRGSTLQIMPLQSAVLPRPCYLVIDRLSELITRPLKDFADLGQIPQAEQSAQTLPVFDNHRVARRFSRRNQRVIKVPDGQLLTRTRPYLQAKGINHLLIDGSVYSLTGEEV